MSGTHILDHDLETLGMKRRHQYLLKLLQTILMRRPRGEPRRENLSLLMMAGPTYLLLGTDDQ